MNADQILNEIREANLSYLMLAQSLIRTDREQALYRLGISEESAALIGLLTPAQMMKIAAGNTLLCRFRMDDDMVWGLLTNHGKSAANDSTNRLHASILMAEAVESLVAVGTDQALGQHQVRQVGFADFVQNLVGVHFWAPVIRFACGAGLCLRWDGF